MDGIRQKLANLNGDSCLLLRTWFGFLRIEDYGINALYTFLLFLPFPTSHSKIFEPEKVILVAAINSFYCNRSKPIFLPLLKIAKSG